VPGDRARRAVEKRYQEDLRRLRAYWPAEQVSLADLARGRRSVRLHSGDTHAFSDDEVERLLARVPVYFHENMTVPLLLRYSRRGGQARYLVIGGPWQRRLAEILLRGTYSFEGVAELRVSEFMELARRYKSLIFVGLTV